VNPGKTGRVSFSPRWPRTTSAKTALSLCQPIVAPVEQPFNAIFGQSLYQPSDGLLSLHGIDAFDETDTALPLEFLERQLERREEAADAAERGDTRALEAIVDEVRTEARELETRVSSLLDVDGAWDGARGPVRELRFLTKVVDDIDVMLDRVEG